MVPWSQAPLSDLPRLVFSSPKTKEVFDDPFYLMAVWDGVAFRPPRPDELIPLPPGSDIFVLPKRYPIGINPVTSSPEVHLGGYAVSAFASPAYLRLSHPAYRKEEGAPNLPLFAYAPIGFAKGRFYTCAVRVDRSHRQDPKRFDLEEIKKRASLERKAHPKNRLIAHLEHCAVVYGCRAAQNFFLGREECPLPTSKTCNATCAGCLSMRPYGGVPAPHFRIDFEPTPEEVAEVALLHISRAKRPVVSFGQGCEGEPLLAGDLLVEAVRLIRKKTSSGTINVNTNGSRPEVVEALCKAGLDSIRLSVNSFQPALYNAYFRPRDYTLDDVILSGRIVREFGGFVSVNLLVFPSVTDTLEDIEATIEGLRSCRADMVQMRNLNIDPDLYLEVIGFRPSRVLGLREAMERFKKALPHLRFGYFNPPVRSLVLRRKRGTP